jgi:flagellar motor switch protein FliG
LKAGKKIDGFKAALELLQALDSAKQQELLADMARKDPEMVLRLKAKLTTFDDLIYLTPQMMLLLWPQTQLADWGLALRGCPPELVSHLLSLLSKNNREDVTEILKGKPRALSDVLKAQEKIMQVVLELKAQGKIVLSKDKSERLV